MYMGSYHKCGFSQLPLHSRYRTIPSRQRSTLVHIWPLWIKYRNLASLQVPLPSLIYNIIILFSLHTLRATSHNVILFASNVKYNVQNIGGERKSIVFTHIFLPNCQVWEIFSHYFDDHFFIPTLLLPSFWDSCDPGATTSSMRGLSRVSFEEDMRGLALSFLNLY